MIDRIYLIEYTFARLGGETENVHPSKLHINVLLSRELLKIFQCILKVVLAVVKL